MKTPMKGKKSPGIRIPTKSKIRNSTGEILNPTKQDVKTYNKRFKTVPAVKPTKQLKSTPKLKVSPSMTKPKTFRIRRGTQRFV